MISTKQHELKNNYDEEECNFIIHSHFMFSVIYRQQTGNEQSGGKLDIQRRTNSA
jgi:hypothetical protein